jgi:predicted restriction endonuclease
MKSKARQELDKNRGVILKLFGNRCAVCGRPSTTIHEIIPLSHGKVAMSIDNRIVLCNFHHDWAHRVGTDNSITILQEVRQDYLTRHQNVENIQENQNRQSISG